MEKHVLEKKRFDEWAETYEESYLQNQLFDRVHRAALDLAPVDQHPESVLDIGCGTGRLLRRVGARWPEAHLIGVDLSEGMIAQARRRTPGAIFYTGPAEKLPLPDASIDLTLSTVSFHHWQDQAAGLAEVRRVLKPDGLFILVDMVIPFHGHPIRPWVIRKTFAQAGLEIVEKKWVLLPVLGIRARMKDVGGRKASDW